MQTLQNGIQVPTNSDPYNLTGDLAAAFDDGNVVIPVSGTTARNALVKRDGMPVARLDLGGVIEIWDADTSTWSRGIQHAEFTGTTAPTNGALWGTGPLSLDSAMSRNGGIFTSPANDKISLPGVGLYSLTVRVQLSVNATGKTWVSIVNDANTTTYANYDIQPGNASGTVSLPNFYAPSTQNIRVLFFSETLTGYTLTSRVRVSRVG